MTGIEVLDMRKFTNKYTTLELIAQDTEHIEEKKIPVSMDVYAQCETRQHLIEVLELMRISK